MKKDFVSVFNNDIAIDEYELDNLLDKNIKVKENEFPTILIDREDDTNKYINIKIQKLEKKLKTMGNKVILFYNKHKPKVRRKKKNEIKKSA